MFPINHWVAILMRDLDKKRLMQNLKREIEAEHDGGIYLAVTYRLSPLAPPRLLLIDTVYVQPDI